MFPILLQIGPITIYSLWLFICLGFFISIIIINKIAESRKVKLNFLANNSLLLFFTGLISARLFFILSHLDFYLFEITNGNFLEIFYIWDKGLSFWGGLIGVLAGLFILCRRYKESFFDWLDILMVSVIFGMIPGTIGAFLDGRNYGIPSNLPWAVTIESSLYAIPIHPVQIYAALYLGLIAFILIKLFDQSFFKNAGNITLMTVILYGFFRFLEEFFRGDETIFIWIFRLPQIMSIAALAAAGYLLFKRFKAYQSESF